jgi:c-di-GMP-related signal transduction protein
MEIPMSEVLEKVPIDQETKAVLLRGNTHLRPLYQLMLAQESGDWQPSAELAKSLNLQESEVAAVYWEAMQWARQMTSSA